MTPNGLAILHDGHRTRLKWHRLRRSWADPLFSAEVMADGLKLGASLELDLRVRADGGFVVLHDADLEGETTGHGLIAEQTRAEMADVRYTEGNRPLTFSEDLAQLLTTAHPDALLQFDMKDDLALIGDKGVAHLTQYFSDPPCPIIVSGDDLNLIAAIRAPLPKLQRGIDPTDKLVDLMQSKGIAAVEDDLLADLKGPTVPSTVYLHWQLVLACERNGLDVVSLCHLHGAIVDAWTFTLKDPAGGFNDREFEAFSRLIAAKVDQITTDEAVATEAAWQERIAP